MQTLETEFVQFQDKNKRRANGDVMIETRRAVHHGKQIRKGLGNKKKSNRKQTRFTKQLTKIQNTGKNQKIHWKRPGRGHIRWDNKQTNKEGNRAD